MKVGIISIHFMQSSALAATYIPGLYVQSEAVSRFLIANRDFLLSGKPEHVCLHTLKS